MSDCNVRCCISRVEPPFEMIIRCDEEHHRMKRRIEEVETETQKGLLKTMIVLCLILFIIFALGTYFLMSSLKRNGYFIEKIEGVYTVCYRTSYGEKYHNSNCQYLWGSSIKTTIYEARKSGLEDCGKCDFAEIDVSERFNPPKAIYLINLIPIIFTTWLYFKIKKDNKEYYARCRKNNDENTRNEILSYVSKKSENDIFNAPEIVKFDSKLFPYLEKDNLVRLIPSNSRSYSSGYKTRYHKTKSCGATRATNFIGKHIVNIDERYYAPCKTCCKKEDYYWVKNYKTIADIFKRHGISVSDVVLAINEGYSPAPRHGIII